MRHPFLLLNVKYDGSYFPETYSLEDIWDCR